MMSDKPECMPANSECEPRLNSWPNEKDLFNAPIADLDHIVRVRVRTSWHHFLSWQI